ncbi:hypothetical protein HanRHA438_Chr01g0008901 [Helianthus annuus]|nr:hypothetical protein HanRHA438_Chr01g0008901 [Helianthus annuus]
MADSLNNSGCEDTRRRGCLGCRWLAVISCCDRPGRKEGEGGASFGLRCDRVLSPARVSFRYPTFREEKGNESDVRPISSI